MKILLVNPITYFYSEKMVPGKFFYMTPGILYVAAIAEKLGHEVVVKNIHHSNFRKLIKKVKPNLVGITCSTPQYNQAVKIAKITKDYDKKITTIIGGYHPTFRWEQILNETEAFDYICIGEGEKTFDEFLKNFNEREKLKKVNGLAFKENNRIVFTGERELISDLDSIPFPARRLVNFPMPFVVGSRGCPYNCKFCAIKNFYKNKYRQRSITNIMEEITLLKELGYKKIVSGDANFGINKKYVLDFCKALKELNFGDIELMLELDPQLLIDDDILKALEETKLKITLEVGIQSVMDKYRKYLNVPGNYELIKKFFEKIKKYNFLRIQYLFLVNSGEENETIEAIGENIDKFFNLINESFNGKTIVFPYFFILVPYPGTDIEKDFIRRGIKIEQNWSLYRTDFCLYGYNDVNKETLEEVFNQLRKKVQPQLREKSERRKFFYSIFLFEVSFVTKIKMVLDFLRIVFLKKKPLYQVWRFLCGKYF